MAINFGAYGAGQNVPQVIDNPVDASGGFTQGLQLGQGLVDREREIQRQAEQDKMAQERHANQMRAADTLQTMREAQMAENDRIREQRDKRIEANRRSLLEQNGIDPSVTNQEAFNMSAHEDADMLTKAPKKDIPGVYENGSWLIDDEEIANRVQKGAQFREGIQENQNLADAFINTPNLDEIANAEKLDVAEAIEDSGYKRGKFNRGTGTYDAIVTVIDDNGKTKEITVPGGDFASYFGEPAQNYDINNVIANGASPVLKALYQGKTVTPQQVNTLIPSLAQQFDTQQKIDSFVRSMGGQAVDPTPGTPWTAEDAAQVALGGIKGVFGQSIIAPTPAQKYSPSQIKAGQALLNYKQQGNNLEYLVNGGFASSAGVDEETGQTFIVAAKNGRKHYLSDDPATRDYQLAGILGVDQGLLNHVTPQQQAAQASGQAASGTLPDDPSQINFSNNVNSSNSAPLPTPAPQAQSSPKLTGLALRMQTEQDAFTTLQIKQEEACKTGSESACKAATKRVEAKQKEIAKLQAKMDEDKAKQEASNNAELDSLIG